MAAAAPTAKTWLVTLRSLKGLISSSRSFRKTNEEWHGCFGWKTWPCSARSKYPTCSIDSTSSSRASRGAEVSGGNKNYKPNQRRNLLIECVQGDRPVRYPSTAELLVCASLQPFRLLVAFLMWGAVVRYVGCEVVWSNVVGCELVWGEVMWVATCHVMWCMAMSCDGLTNDVRGRDVMRLWFEVVSWCDNFWKMRCCSTTERQCRSTRTPYLKVLPRTTKYYSVPFHTSPYYKV